MFDGLRIAWLRTVYIYIVMLLLALKVVVGQAPRLHDFDVLHIPMTNIGGDL